ncbi:MAG: D-alanyl-D-alanine carboxypeptidase [Alphaproteobacteria bacterium]|nr:D-alanyl-D-alanine carboxypeptidase [Alphaproteobacteria bacterium]MCB1551340.1 D-alanyl-D-alanine carboxypeptidase [Alphaproteobacteria bacterium]MCB9984725.1 D-alanyl-D-alanine carboxypeptidase [Micavibrio sp.]HRK98392.1 D-alanyl-D-alanine carboxypeptidase family protein [Alphaproteobacteria bacterium]
MKFILSFLLLTLLSVPSFAQEITLPETSAKQAYIVDFDTGVVLYNKNGEERMPTSSMSKVLTTIVADDAIRAGTISKDQKITVSEKAWKTGGSRMFLDLNSEVSVGDLLKGIVIQSGNDACVALAEGIAGSEANFVVMMNRKAEEIGMKDSHFMNSNGWPDPNHYSTAKDLALLGTYLIKTYPEEYKVYAEKEFTYNNIKQGNRNPLLYKNIGADGIKTGHTDDGGYGLMGSAVAGDRRVVLVINGTTSMQARADESSKLMEWALTSFKNVNLFEKGTVMAQVPVVLSPTRQINLIVNEQYRTTVPSFAKDAAKVNVTYKSPVVAPVKAGDVLGSARLVLPDGTLKEVSLVAAVDVEESSFFKRLSEKLMILLVGVPE